MISELVRAVRDRFPLCSVRAWSEPSDSALYVEVEDSGGLRARERLDLATLEAGSFGLVARLADVFETPSHWMAL